MRMQPLCIVAVILATCQLAILDWGGATSRLVAILNTHILTHPYILNQSWTVSGGEWPKRYISGG